MYKTFINRPIFAMVISIVIVLLGGLAITRLPVEQYPDITPPVVEVTASYTGADAGVVADAVAVPIEESVMGTDNMLYMQSTSAGDGSMTLQILFDVGSDADMDQVFAQNNVATATPLLPEEVTRQGVTTQKIQTGFLLVYALHSDGRYDSKFLSNYAYINLRNELLKINGVGKVQIMGAGEYSMRIWINPDLLDYYGVSVEEIASAIEAQSGTFPAGKFGQEPMSTPTDFTYTVTLPAEINTPEEYADIIVKTLPDGEQLLLGEVARVELGVESYGVDSAFDGKPGSLMVVYQEPGSNAMSVGRQVKATMATLAERFPTGVEYDTVVDATLSISEGVREIVKTLLFALVLVVLIIYLFLQDVRATLIPLVAIPVSLVGAFMLFPLLGFSINIISLLGLVLAIGLVVDDAIIVVEATQVHIEQGMEPRKATAKAMRSVAQPIVATTIVILAVFVPVSFIGGVAGKLFQQFSVGISVAVVISAFNALTLSPALCSLLLRPAQEKKKGFFGGINRVIDGSLRRYNESTTRTIRRTTRVVLMVVVSLVAIFGLMKALPSAFLPTEDQGYLLVTVTTPDAASTSRTSAAIDDAREVIGSIDGVVAQASASGFDLLSGIASTNSGIIFVELAPYAKRKLTAGEIAEQINMLLAERVASGNFYAFQPPAIPGLGVTDGITFMLQDRSGGGVEYLAQMGDSLKKVVSKLPEIASLTTQFNAYTPQRMLKIDRELAMQQGVSLSELHNLIATYLGGSYINNFNRFGQLYRTYIQADAEYRRDKHSLDNYYVTSDSGESLPLSGFVTVIDTVGAEYITRFNLYNAISYTATPAKGYSTAQAMNALSKAIDEQLPDDISLAWSGVSFQEAQTSQGEGTTYLLALVFIFLALAALYDSWALPVSVMMGVPFAVMGALLVVWVAHLISPIYTDNVYMTISLVMLISLAAKNAILVVEYANRLFFEEGKSLEEAAMGAAKLRVRPIVMTALAFIIGVLPLVFASGAYSTARRVMGLALVGGMSVATMVGIFVYPALYYLIGRWNHLEKKRERKAKQIPV